MTDRESLYGRVDAGKLEGAYQRTLRSVEIQAQQVEEYPSTPYSQSNAETLEATSRALATMGDELRAWHLFLHPEILEDYRGN